MIRTLLISACLFFSVAAKAQDVDIKDNSVLYNGKEILKCKKATAVEYSFYSLNDDEILAFRFNDNETPRYSDDDYFVMKFLTAKKKVESKSYKHVISGMGMNGRKNMQKIVGWLLEEKVLDANGALNLDKLEIFVEKYNEDLTSRTIR